MIASVALLPVVLVLGTVASAPDAASAPSAAMLAAADRLLAATHFAERRLPPPDVEAIVQAGMVDCMGRNADAAKPADCEHQAERTRATATGIAAGYPRRRAALLQAAARIYAARLTVTDMDAASAFYESAPGRRLTEAAPAMDAAFAREATTAAFRALADADIQATDGPPPQ